MRTVVQDKYFLRDLHREIDLFDRKLVHALKHEVFATEALRDAATRKLVTKRESLAATARTLAASGIEFADGELPRSFRPEGWTAVDMEASAPQTAVAVTTMERTEHPTAFGEQVSRMQHQAQALREEESPLATALGSWQDDLAAYKKKRQKNTAAAL